MPYRRTAVDEISDAMPGTVTTALSNDPIVVYWRQLARVESELAVTSEGQHERSLEIFSLYERLLNIDWY